MYLGRCDEQVASGTFLPCRFNSAVFNNMLDKVEHKILTEIIISQFRHIKKIMHKKKKHNKSMRRKDVTL